MKRNFLLTLVFVFGTQLAICQVVTDKVTVELLPISGNVGIGTSDPQTKLDVQGSARINGTATVDRLEIGPLGQWWLWKSYSQVYSGNINNNTETVVIPSGFIRHGFGFKLLVKVTNNSANWNYNRFEEVIGTCRHPSFSGSSVTTTHTSQPWTGTNGEINGIYYTVTGTSSGCEVKMKYTSVGNHGSSAVYVIKAETL